MFSIKHRIAFALIMGVITTGIISFTLISINLGYTDLFFKIWIKSWAMAHMVVIPAILVIGPRLQKLVNYLFREKITSNEYN